MTTSKKMLTALLMLVTTASSLQAQNDKEIFEAFNHLDFGVTMGSTGLGIDLATPFPRITWKDAMTRYGSDKPDTRFGLEMHDVTALFAASPALLLACD